MVEKADGALVPVTKEERLAYQLARSQVFPDSMLMPVAIAKAQAGKELGIGPATSQTFFHVINGKLAISARGLGALIKKSGKYDFEWVRQDSKAAEVIFYEKGREPKRVAFTYEDAKTGGLITGKNADTWRKWGDRMLVARLFSKLVSVYCPDVVAGAVVYTEEETADIQGQALAEKDPDADLVVVPDEVPGAAQEAVDAEFVTQG